MLAITIGLAAVVGGCGGDDSNSGSSGGTSTTANASGCTQEAQKMVEAAKKPMELVVPDKPIDMSKNAGKTIWHISPTQATGYASRVSKAVEEAAAAAGMKAEIFDGKAQPDRFNQGIEQAVASKAAGIITYAINPAIVPAALKKAKDAGIPVIGVATGVPNPTDGSLVETISVDLEEEGAQMAQYAASMLDCNVNAAVTFDPNQKALTTQRDAINAELQRLCPDTCKTMDHEMSLATMATQLGSSVQSLLQRSPDLNVVISTFDTAALYMAPAIEQTGAKVKIVATNGLPENLDMVRQDKVQVADVAYPPTEYAGWLIVDQLSRAMLGEPVENTKLPLQLFDKENLAASNDFEALWPKMTEYQAAFKEKWGV